jgi:hypothetical protein
VYRISNWDMKFPFFVDGERMPNKAVSHALRLETAMSAAGPPARLSV